MLNEAVIQMGVAIDWTLSGEIEKNGPTSLVVAGLNIITLFEGSLDVVRISLTIRKMVNLQKSTLA